MELNAIAWLVLRVVFVWLYLYALKGLLMDWQSAQNLVKIITPHYTQFLAVLMILVMAVGAIMILFGIYAQIAGLLLLIYNLIGAKVHYTLAKTIQVSELYSPISDTDNNTLNEIKTLGAIGHITSAQKNFVLAALAFFFLIVGTGPFSLTSNLW